MQIENQKLVAGTLWNWEESVADYPASTHQLKYLLKKPNLTTIELAATANGDAHVITQTVIQTALYSNNSGWYVCQPIIVNRSDAADITDLGESFLVEIFPDLNTKPDPRSFAMKMIDAIETSIYALAQKTMSSVSIEGHTYTYKDEDKLIERLNYWERKAGKYKRKRTLIQFDNN